MMGTMTALPNTLMRSDLKLKGLAEVYRGKVRDVYHLEDGRTILVASDRISAFDVVLPRGIPHKGQVLSQVSWHMLEATRQVAPNWAIASPEANDDSRTTARSVPLLRPMVAASSVVGTPPSEWPYSTKGRPTCRATVQASRT